MCVSKPSVCPYQHHPQQYMTYLYDYKSMPNMYGHQNLQVPAVGCLHPDGVSIVTFFYRYCLPAIVDVFSLQCVFHHVSTSTSATTPLVTVVCSSASSIIKEQFPQAFTMTNIYFFLLTSVQSTD